ncbi:cilia- and flagella-associated protein 45 isoform X1 [Anguilla rostrata]|uniref:cilia- and flagella-associated protein 45 isoform X1 n=1 Tax=Anguilla rostrata TaxID=7938 RepID=UPI0030D00E6F
MRLLKNNPPQSTMSSSCVRGPGPNRYRTRAHTSQVDELLFGSPKKVLPPEQPARDPQDGSLWGSPGPRGVPQSSAHKKPKPETVRIITKDLIRDLKIPSQDPSGLSIILPKSETNRITTLARVPTKEEREAKLEAREKDRKAVIEAVEERKVKMHQADVVRKKNQGLSDLEAEARDNAQYLLEKANKMRVEQEDEVKKINDVIRGAQCHAVQDMQILEKQQILAELQEEERRLDSMMEVDRRRALEAQEQIEQLRKQHRILGKMHIQEQIEERMEERRLQEEMKQQEKQKLLESLEKIRQDEFEALMKKKEEQRKLHKEVLKMNEEILQAKESKMEEERLADLRIMEYSSNKLEQEAEYEKEQSRLKKEKEMEVARLRSLQERDKDYKAEQDELRARRNQEAAEREWRKKEREQAKRRAEEEEWLKAARLEQITHKEHLLSIEAGRERAEFERVLRAQNEEIRREKEREERQRHRVLRHADGVRQQMREREVQAMEQRRAELQEHERLLEEVRSRRARLNEIKAKKLMELKMAGLPAKYCHEVERKVLILPDPAE